MESSKLKKLFDVGSAKFESNQILPNKINLRFLVTIFWHFPAMFVKFLLNITLVIVVTEHQANKI